MKKENLEIENFMVLNFLQIAQSQSVGTINEKKKLIFDKVENKFYFQKFYNYQALVLGKIQKLYQQTKQNFLDSKTNSSITQYLNQEKQLDKIQKEAIAKAFSLPFTIISGSPGTGKTFVWFVGRAFVKNLTLKLVVIKFLEIEFILHFIKDKFFFFIYSTNRLRLCYL